MPTRYHEFAIEGPPGRALGFLEGFLAGRGHAGRALDAWTEGFDCDSLRERVRRLLSLPVDTFHLLVPEDLVPALEEGIESAGEQGMPLEVRARRPVASARFDFRLVAYSREHARRIRGYFHTLPEGVSLSPETTFEEKVDPSAKGVEAYAPAHHYELRGQGTVEGELGGVVTVHRLCRGDELVQPGRIELVTDGE